MPGRLLDDAALAASDVVANAAMNRSRQLAGVNSYTKELGFHPLDLIARRLERGTVDGATVGWLDLCCGTGHALIRAADQLRTMGLADQVVIVGVDLVDVFDPVPQPTPGLELVCASARMGGGPPVRSHHLRARAALRRRQSSPCWPPRPVWLTDDGLLVADVDLAAVRLPDGRPAGRPLAAALRAAGFDCDPRRHRIRRTGRGEVVLPYTYLGAVDGAGPNYTAQPAVDSYYVARRAGAALPRT